MPDNTLRIGAEFDVSQIVAGSAQASGAMEELGTTVGEASAAMLNQLYPAEEAAQVQSSSLTAAIEALTAAMIAKKAVTEGAAVATSGFDRAIASATGRVAGMEAGMGMAGSAIGRLAAFLPGMGPLFAIALPVALIAMAVEKITEFRDEVEKASQKAADFAIESYKVADSIELENLKLGQQIQVLEGGVKSNNLKIAIEEAQIAAESLGKSLEKDIQASIELLNVGELSQFFTSASGNEKQFKDDLQKIIGDIQNARLALAQAPPGSEAANAAIESQIAAYKRFSDQLDIDIKKLQEESAANAEAMENAVAAGGTLLLPTDFDASIQKLKSMQIGAAEAVKSLELMQEHGKLEVKVGGLEDIKAAEDAAKKAAKAKQDLLRLAEEEARAIARISEEWRKYNAAVAKMTEEQSEFFAKDQEKEISEALKAAEEKAKAWQKYTEEIDKLAEQSALKQIADQEAAVSGNAKLLEQKLSMQTVSEYGRSIITEQVNAQELASLKKLEDEKIAVEMKYLEQSKAILLGGQTEQQFVVNADPEQLAKLESLNRQIEAAQLAHNAKMDQLSREETANAQKAAAAQTDAYMKAFAPINRAMDGMVNGILQGTLSVSQAFRRMGVNIVVSTVDALAQMALKWAEHFLIVQVLEHSSLVQRLATFVAGESVKKSIQVAAAAGEVTESAGIGAAAAFASVLEALPFPINVATAPEVAATQFAAIEAIGLPKMEMGGFIPRTMPILAHAGETVLSPKASQDVGKMAQTFNAGAGGDTTNVNMHVSALDSKSVADFLHSNRGQFTKMIRTAVRNGVRVKM